MRDLRDPTLLGELILGIKMRFPRHALREIADCSLKVHRIRDYNHNPGPIEKYGRPQDLPSTLPN